jgi:hypothetical protein
MRAIQRTAKMHNIILSQPSIASSLSLSLSSRRFISSESESHFRDAGYLDESGLTSFDTLHELQVRSCKVFEGNELFGTYQEHLNGFEYMTYGQYDKCVDACRTVLIDLGKRERNHIFCFQF